ncbi:AAA family ATPase [bacterium]|nr:MAG: AAA family ATPase [bacterium]
MKSVEKYQRILITGIPGTGKTTIGDALKDMYSFQHVDLECRDFKKFKQNSKIFIDELVNSQKNIVVTWGFMPNEKQINIVLSFKNKGFKLVWLDGNREVARKIFNQRGTVKDELFQIQLSRIDNFNVINKINPLIYNTFKKNGTFKKIKVILEEIQNL